MVLNRLSLKYCPWPTSAPFSAAFHVNRAAAFHRKAELLEPLISVLRMHPNGQKETVAKIYSVPLPRPIIFLLGFMPAHAKCFRGQLTELRTILCGKRTKPRKTITPGQCGNRPAAAAFRLEAAT